MKAFKIPLVAALLFASVTSQAKTSYQWVKMNESQRAAFAAQCAPASVIQKIAFAGTGAAIGTFITKGTIDGMENGDLGVSGAVTAVGGTLSAGVYLYFAIEYYLHADEMSALVSEQESGQAGLMTEALEQISAENQLDANKMLAALNLRVLDKNLCNGSLDDKPRFADLGEDQRGEKAAAAAQVKHEALTQEKAELVQQHAKVSEQLKNK